MGFRLTAFLQWQKGDIFQFVLAIMLFQGEASGADKHPRSKCYM
jgi:hypothetical protein